MTQSSLQPDPAASGQKPFDLEDRTYEFAKGVRAFVKKLPRTICNIEDVKQVARASGSVGANYIEANEALGRKDFLMKIRTCRREAKESRYFLRLLDTGEVKEVESRRQALIQEAHELASIFGAIITKSS